MAPRETSMVVSTAPSSNSKASFQRFFLALLLTVGLTAGGFLGFNAAFAEDEVEEPAVQGKLYEPGHDIVEVIRQHNTTAKNLGGQFYMVDQNVLNAWTDGKDVYMSQKLWDTLKTDDQKAFVISHELSHKALRHVEKTTARRFGLSALLRFFSRKHPTSALVGSLGAKLMEQRFSRSAEYNADALGLEFLTNAGYDSHAAVEVLDILGAASPRSTPEFLSSHPMSRSRIEALMRKHPTKFSTQTSSQ